MRPRRRRRARGRRAPAPRERPGRARCRRPRRRGGRGRGCARRVAAARRTRAGRARGRRRGRTPGSCRARARRGERHLQREREEHDPGDHREVEVGVDVAGEGDASAPCRSVSSCWTRIGKKSKYASQNDVATTRPSSAATMTPASRSVLARAEADRDQGLADRDDHDQPVPLDEVRRRQPPAADVDDERPEEADRERRDPQPDFSAPSTNPAARISAAPARLDGNDVQRSPPKHSGSAAGRKRVQREVHDATTRKATPKTTPSLPNASGTASARRTSPPSPRASPAEHGVLPGVDAVRQPRVRRPRPPQRREDQQPVPDPGPGLVVQEHDRHLREREDEDEIEEQLERRDPMLALDGLLAHGRRLTQPAPGRAQGSPRDGLPIWGDPRARPRDRPLGWVSVCDAGSAAELDSGGARCDERFDTDRAVRPGSRARGSVFRFARSSSAAADPQLRCVARTQWSRSPASTCRLSRCASSAGPRIWGGRCPGRRFATADLGGTDGSRLPSFAASIRSSFESDGLAGLALRGLDSSRLRSGHAVPALVRYAPRASRAGGCERCPSMRDSWP